MFQTSHPYSSFHAAGRCLSGGPIYFTDEPGRHDTKLIEQMTGQTPRGKTVILRPTIVGKSTGVYTAYEEERLLRVGTFAGGKGTGTGILGLFNVSQRPLPEFVNLSEFPGIEIGKRYIVRGHTTGEVSHPLMLHDQNTVISLEIQVKEWEILTAYPLQSFLLRGSPHLKHPTTDIAVLGLLGKMTGAAAILSTKIYVENNQWLRISTSIKTLGILGKHNQVSGLSSREAAAHKEA